MKILLVPATLVAAVLLTGCPAASNSPQSAPPVTTATGKALPTKTAAPASSKPASSTLADNGWTVVSIQIKNDGIGDLGGLLRVRNDTGDAQQFISFTVTVLKGGQPVGSLLGSIGASVSSGKTVSIDMVSTDKYVKGPYTYEFQAQ